jgi:hypothetical protein
MAKNKKMSDDMERIITEAEIEAQIEEGEVKEDAPGLKVESAEVPKQTAPEEKELSKTRRIYRRILVWLVVIAIVFAGGFFSDTLLRYQPEKKRNEQLEADLGESGETITNLEVEIEGLSIFKHQNEILVEENSRIIIHLTLLGARTAVADSQLALAQNRQADAIVSLASLGTTLETLKTLVNSNQAEVVENMIQRQKLILIELDTDGLSAQSDLQVLSARLSALENTLFAAP